jgi:hypothetical protein
VSGTDALAHNVLSVVRNDAACELTITELVSSSSLEPRSLVPPITMTGSYAAAGSAVGSGESTFYANARLGSTGFADPFVVSLLTSDDPSLASLQVTYPVVTAAPTVVAAASASINEKQLTVVKPPAPWQAC